MENSFDIYNAWRCVEKNDAEGCLIHGLFLQNLQRRGKMGVIPIGYERALYESNHKATETTIANQLQEINNQSNLFEKEEIVPFEDPVLCDDRHRKALVFLKRSCVLGNPLGCKFHAQPESMKRAMQLWEDGCNKGDGFQCIELSRAFLNQKNDEQAKKWREKGILLLQTACEHNKDREACNIAGEENFRNKNEKKAVELFTKGCDMGEGASCFHLGLRYKENSREYLEFMKKSCNSENGGTLSACWKFGNWLVDSADASKNESERMTKLVAANGYFKKACKLGEFQACLFVSSMRRHGHPHGDKNKQKQQQNAPQQQPQK